MSGSMRAGKHWGLVIAALLVCLLFSQATRSSARFSAGSHPGERIL